jgi:hypothetical protein
MKTQTTMPKPGDTITLFGVTYTAKEPRYTNPATAMVWDGGLQGGEITQSANPLGNHPFYASPVHYKTIEKAASATQAKAVRNYEEAKAYIARWEALPA